MDSLDFFRAIRGVLDSYLEMPLAFGHYLAMVTMEELVGEEWADWYRLTPIQLWLETQKLWQSYLAFGGSLDPESDTQSPFFDPEAPGPLPPYGRPGVRIVRRGRV